ncbi:hypothetical protein PIB30_097754 [Stylosanthes scabra]|uniref:Uncharacterized protein n=1 Tax=Stylosanthes scabra TaxID=79078 RepID=A0ABU6VW48_9FABA|nr:hypothetical protein [Stylosanthes scabra]
MAWCCKCWKILFDYLTSKSFRARKPLQPKPQPHPQPEPDRAAKKARKPTLDDQVERASDQHDETPQTHSIPQPQPQRTPTESNNSENPAIDDSEDESQPPPPKMMIPKSEEATLSTEEAQPPPSQTVVEVVNIYPTQEVIDLSSSLEEDRQQPIVPKEEQDVDTSPSPRSRIISSVLVSIRREHQPMEPPSFDLGVEPPLLTPQTMDAIDEIDDQLQKNPSLLRTLDPLGTFNILADMEIRLSGHNP